MVFGNMDERSGTGVAFTRNPSTGEPAPCGDFLFCAQGDDVVGGGSRTLPLQAFEQAMPDVYRELASAMDRLETYYRDMCDIEFTVERGRLWLLQARVGKRSPLAAPRIAVDLVREGRVGLQPAEAAARIDPELLSGATSIARASTEGAPASAFRPAPPPARLSLIPTARLSSPRLAKTWFSCVGRPRPRTSTAWVSPKAY
jgi:pyruvate,orthophosphate dikinase